ncbi:MAG: FecR family protein [Planctomycetota bacterium]
MSVGREPDPSERELEDLLARLPSEPVDAARRDAARAAFLAAAGAQASRAEPPLRTREAMDASSEQAFALWLARVAPAEPARSERRARARAAFLSGLAASAPGPRPVSRRLRAVAVLLAVAGILLVTFLLPGTTAWRIELLGPVAFDDEEFRLIDEGRLASELQRPGRLQTRGTPARLVLSDALELELRADSELLVPGLPELDGGEPILFELVRGEVFVRTRERWRGNPLFVRTAFGDVRDLGTTFGVLVTADCMCVCVADGAVEVDGGGVPERVEANTSALFSRRSDPNPGRSAFPTLPDDAAHEHTGPLVLFRDEP